MEDYLFKYLDLKVPGVGIGIWIIWRFLVKSIYRFIKRLIEMKKQHEYMMSIMETVAKELKPNGGSSIKDSINCIENNLQIIKEKQKVLFGIQQIPLFETDHNGLYVYVNRYYCDISDMSQEEAIGYGWTNALHPEDKESVIIEWENSVKHGKEFKSEYRFLNKNNESIPVICHAFPLKDKTGNTIGYEGRLSIKK